MPSQRKRLPLTLSSELDKALTDLAAALEKPVATVTTEMLVEMIPQLEGLTKYALAMKAGKSQAARKALGKMMGDTIVEQLEFAATRKGRK